MILGRPQLDTQKGKPADARSLLPDDALRQSRLIANSPDEEEVMRWIHDVSDMDSCTPEGEIR